MAKSDEPPMAFRAGRALSAENISTERDSTAVRPPDMQDEATLRFQALGGRRFEILAYFLVLGEEPAENSVTLMQGGSDQGRDLLVHDKNGNLKRLIQCKNWGDAFTDTKVGLFLAELSMYFLGDTAFRDRATPLDVELWCAGGFSHEAASLIDTFPKFADLEVAEEWIEKRASAVKALKDVDRANALTFFTSDFRDRVRVIKKTGIDLTAQLADERHQVLKGRFFEVRKVVDRALIVETVPALVRQALEDHEERKVRRIEGDVGMASEVLTPFVKAHQEAEISAQFRVTSGLETGDWLSVAYRFKLLANHADTNNPNWQSAEVLANASTSWTRVQCTLPALNRSDVTGAVEYYLALSVSSRDTRYRSKFEPYACYIHRLVVM